MGLLGKKVAANRVSHLFAATLHTSFGMSLRASSRAEKLW